MSSNSVPDSLQLESTRSNLSGNLQIPTSGRRTLPPIQKPVPAKLEGN